MRDIRLAAAMARAVVGEKSGNLERTRSLARRAAEAGAEVLILPEASLSGYTVRESMRPHAETVPGPLTGALTELARETNLVIGAGLVEIQDEQCFLTQVIAGPEGLVGSYRKTHLGPTERTLFAAGKELKVIEANGAKLGMALCYEGHFPEVSLTLALKGAEIILLPHASPREEPGRKLERWLRYMPARAYDNTVFVVANNQSGDNGAGLTFAGVALILGPKGEILAQLAGESDGLVVADLRAADLAVVRSGRMGFFLPERRPELYGRT